MRVLLDTHLLLWAASEPKRLSVTARRILTHADTELLFSTASLWEIAIKNALGRPDFAIALRPLRRGLVENGYEELPVTGEHVLALEQLPPLHSDPFDRVLVAQARSEGIQLLTHDAAVAAYGEGVRKV